MIVVNKQICYSNEWPLWPLPVKEWNLVWLSAADVRIYGRSVPTHLAMVVATLRHCRREGVPEWPYLLALEPVDFFEGFQETNWRGTSAYAAMGEGWLDIMQRKIEESYRWPLPTQRRVLAKDGPHHLTIDVPVFLEAAR